MNRRDLLRTGAAGAAAAQVSRADAVPLREKFFGCIAGVHIGSSMGATVDGWSWERIEKEHGTLTKLLPYEHYRNGWKREPGTTEDGVERQKLMITAIIEKKDRVTAEDVRKIWARDIRHPGMVSEPFEAQLLALAKTQIPASDIGKYCDYAGLISMARSCHPIGLINAGDPAGALQDTYEVGQLYNTANSRGLRWAGVTTVAIAAATRPAATVDSVIGAVFDHCDRGVRGEIERALKMADKARDFKELRRAFDAIYSGQGIPYAHSYANEIVSKAMALFKLTKGRLHDAMIAGVNFGRDTDCLTAVAAGISGALSGGSSMPKELIEQSDRATKLNQYTNSQRTLRETSDGLYEAYQARLKRLKTLIAEMETGTA
ncbi:MAG: ADP-ribosylglycohydrolase family protein [Acidobacteria bacterium]|nr:ADP-ribosylglycohydrolase family protein [Acidobacteriota bacterium]